MTDELKSPENNIDPEAVLAAIEVVRERGWDVNLYTVADQLKLSLPRLYRSRELMDLIRAAHGSSGLREEDVGRRLKELAERINELKSQLEFLRLVPESLTQTMMAEAGQEYCDAIDPHLVKSAACGAAVPDESVCLDEDWTATPGAESFLGLDLPETEQPGSTDFFEEPSAVPGQKAPEAGEGRQQAAHSCGALAGDPLVQAGAEALMDIHPTGFADFCYEADGTGGTADDAPGCLLEDDRGGGDAESAGTARRQKYIPSEYVADKPGTSFSEEELRDLLKQRFVRQPAESEGEGKEVAAEKPPGARRFVGSGKPTSEAAADGGNLVRVIPPDVRKACLVLGLRPDELSLESVQKAWKHEMAAPAGHPDLGGNTEGAVYLNRAKDILMSWLQAREPKLGKRFGSAREPGKAADRDPGKETSAEKSQENEEEPIGE